MERIRTETRRYEDDRIVSKTAESRNGRVRQTDFSYSSASGELETIVVRNQDGAVVESLTFSYGYAGAPE